MSVSKIKNQDCPLDFEWSLKPILVLMRVVLGIDLNPSTHPSVPQICYKIFRLSFGFLMVVFTIFANILQLILKMNSTYDTSPENPIASLNLTQSNLVVIRITTVNETIFNVAIYMVFYVVVLMNAWKPLWVTLQQLQIQSPQFDREFYRSCRKITYGGLFSIFVNFTLNLFLAFNFNPPNLQLLDSLSLSSAKISETISQIIITFFCVLVWVVSRIFSYLNLKAAEFPSILMSSSFGSISFISSYLENWRRHYTLVCQLVDRINTCFGIIVLVAMAFSFVTFITDTYEITLAFTNSNTLQTRFLIRLFQHIILLTSVCFLSYRLEEEALKTIKRLRLINFSSVSPNLQLQLDGMMIEVTEADVKIVAADFFDVNLTLIPTLIGTTLTYLIILYQQTFT